MKTPVRMFQLINARGETKDLLDVKHFAHDPQGLGVQLSGERTSASGYHRLLSATSNLVTPSFEMMFGGDTFSNAYDKFYEFTQFLAFRPLQLRYVTTAFDYLADVDVASMSKGEISEDGILRSELVLNRSTPWYKEKEVIIGQRPWPKGAGKIYHSEDNIFYGNRNPYIYGVNLDIPTLPYQEFIIPATFSDPHTDGFGARFKVTSRVDGYEDPVVELITKGAFGVETKQVAKYFVSLNEGESIEVSSHPRNYYAYKLDKNGKIIDNIIDVQDWMSEGFLSVMPGENVIRIDPVTTEAQLSLIYREEAVLA